MALSNIRIVLVRPTHPGNVGATARAMKNMSLRSLYLVEPEKFPSPEATDRAVGADDVLQGAVICASLDEALKDCHLVIGTSARMRRIEWPTLDPAAGANRLVQGAQHGPVAFLFGQERTGLLNSELDRCHFVVTIPADPSYSSLNLASAVQILAYEIYRAALAEKLETVREPREGRPASDADMQRFYQHLEEVLQQIGFLDPANPRFLMRRLMRLFNRAGLDDNEMNILRGILTATQQGRHKT
ncbi:MAG: tRNA (cytosine(32)/uridine(32)-2'-O)-methyltransferase TrmJ [Candidatus Muproteobacteria bacterium RIFCSPHIGHO2_12_FULL_60_33]|uniref:tRNA (cytidine/uridine-2'-O-)-methyltransferase TrmJ n=1 Tax=Candidatus Muproteobacteria bacterium RIFCSPLOWO2_01_FULL_60_18 TaxID=1817768 RepID=A0A1F6U0Y8_9PROT|nr:MAG: tRNA (cytosine(32)/uridine(32)-2'-O)-methyltransferase TrmJ [Candidatus Muproteobacteria bacterium RIFCSPHIGHO2_01_60_12]OGI50992.1 MAG: tRNA (cytosine(32)/uridine(32)-2'-O)-methyltransferase TrmJ [Candidatus Muproteobacteria bacterium RIFCSPLOWO2_01_FULL_60_18]OGI55635.1 MAG: tRNA (cytosine(32)/uridine(32)-2'-O)-methyltransferase TrmJ [Candidatus Muproteobacteria bacterium RIFCSPHIGHO2_12_FULL_60_33]OGI59892.1 MAG: tRNA (cytosine(32)/uridine(32)-2'-O)-methyltransferase TrmJ [Candidatus 